MNSIHDINSTTPEQYARVIADQYLHDLTDWQKMYKFLKENDSEFVMSRIFDIAQEFDISFAHWVNEENEAKWFAVFLSQIFTFCMPETITGEASINARAFFLEIIEHIAMQEAAERFERP